MKSLGKKKHQSAFTIHNKRLKLTRERNTNEHNDTLHEE